MQLRVDSLLTNRSQRKQPVNRIVLLGASNLTMSLRLVIQSVQERFGRPSDVLVAAGHGRSYGQDSRVLARGLPGITACGLWPQLDAASQLPTCAFLTDVGNDIVYGCTPQRILRWVSWCVDRLQQHRARIVMLNLPMAAIESLSERRYKVFRSILFPFCRLSRQEAFDRAQVVHKGLVALAQARDFTLCEPDPSWYGPDAIHILYWRRNEAYRRVVAGALASAAATKAERALAWKSRPQFAYSTMLGTERHRRQPSGQLDDGTAVSLY